MLMKITHSSYIAKLRKGYFDKKTMSHCSRHVLKTVNGKTELIRIVPKNTSLTLLFV